MYFVIAAVVLSAFAKVAGATPVAGSTTIEGVAQKEPIANYPVQTLDGPLIDITNITSLTAYTTSSTGLHSLAADAVFPATLQLCSQSGCSGCFNFDLSVLTRETCFFDGSSVINSIYINQPSNEGLPFGVYVGPSCSNLVQIPSVNTCYNAVNGPFSVFELTD